MVAYKYWFFYSDIQMNVLGCFCFLLVFENLIHTYNNLIISTLHTPFPIPLKYHYHHIFLQNHVLFYKIFIQINWLVSFNSPSTISAAHMHMAICLSTGAKVSLFPSAATTHSTSPTSMTDVLTGLILHRSHTGNNSWGILMTESKATMKTAADTSVQCWFHFLCV